MSCVHCVHLINGNSGDHVLIAKETARQLGMGTNIQGANKLPSFDASEGIPKDLAEKYGDMILEADGFAQVFPEHKVWHGASPMHWEGNNMHGNNMHALSRETYAGATSRH